MNEPLAALASFAEGMKLWLYDRQKAALFSLAQREEPSHIQGESLWKAFLTALLEDISDLDFTPIARELAALGQYQGPLNLKQWFQQSLLGQFPAEIAEGLKESLFALLAQQDEWLEGGWKQKISANPLAALAEIEESLLLPTPWEGARFLNLLGFAYPCSKGSFHAFLRYWGGGQRLRYADWYDLLSRQVGEVQKASAQDQVWDWAFSAKASGILPSLCQEKPDCFACPLKAECQFYQKTRSKNQIAQVENALTLANPEEQSSAELLAYLL